VGFASRKPELVVYAMGGIDEKRLARLGKHRMGKGCLYVKKLADVDVQVLEEIVAASIAELKQRHPG
jgi:hypothetical protein